MEFLLGTHWTLFFDLVIVDTDKPSWFRRDSEFLVYLLTGEAEIGADNVSSEGSCGDFCHLLFNGHPKKKTVLYVGDHIYSDILRSKLENYADLYGSSCFHLLDYHPSLDFRAKFKLMPHESPMDQSKADNQQCQAADQHGQAADGYLTPNTEELIFKLCIDYPLKICSLVYSNKFAIRGLWYDKKRANVRKVQNRGDILRATLGRQFLTWREIGQLYLRKIVQLNPELKVMNTFYDLPETALSADFEGVNYGEATKTYTSIFEDVQDAMKYVHSGDGPMKAEILLNPDQYVEKETRRIMEFLLDTKWSTFFDVVIVDAEKPLMVMLTSRRLTRKQANLKRSRTILFRRFVLQ
ncbi:hypothetical protein niasHS_003006 [Heterodera schachtii]|uniref:Uncharacterized protein n=1 Tax=Heterodera schachtii TaxID=97005 RepID=A0ABD2K9K6_HETSC